MEKNIPKGRDCYDKTGVCKHYEVLEFSKYVICKSKCNLLNKIDEKLNRKFKICDINK